MILPESGAQAHTGSYGKLVAFVMARTRDVAAAEDALSEAFASALAGLVAEWLSSNPEA